MSRSKISRRSVLLNAMLGLLAAASPVAAAGPDVTVFELAQTANHGVSGGIRGYSVATISCNMGDQPVNWCGGNSTTSCGLGTTRAEHPVIAQNLYRLKNGRFEQIGASWLKHGFESLNGQASECGSGQCVPPPLGASQLGAGCIDPYSANMNGSRPLGRRSEVNSATGAFPFPYGGGGATAAAWNQRLAVAESDLAAASNPGALYFIEGQYVAADDAMAGNGLNNASTRRVSVLEPSFNLQPEGSITHRQKAAIEMWPEFDATVELLNVDAPTFPVERFHAARKVTALGGGMWHYEYAVHNLSSQRAASRLAISFAGPTLFANAGFHDVDAHSGEPYDTTDWASATSAGSIAWAAPHFVPPENANALRWGTTYSFFFDASRPPEQISAHALELFVPGLPASLVFWEAEGQTPLFADGFETGTTARWSAVSGLAPAARPE